jgi:hypothetical protein
MAAPAFDPSKPFEVVSAPAFDPNKSHEPVAAPADAPGYLESILRGGAQGITLGGADELTGLLESMFTAKTYAQARDESRDAYKVAHDANPITSTIAEIGGGFATPGIGAVSGGVKGLGGALKMGAAFGGLNALGHTESDKLGDIAKDTAVGAGTGALIGGAAHGVGKGLSFVADKVGKTITESTNPVIQRLQAFGVKMKDLMKPGGERLIEHTEEMNKMGAFAPLPSGKNPDMPDLAQFIFAKKPEVVNRLVELVDSAGAGRSVDPEDVAFGLKAVAHDFITKATPDVAAGLQSQLDDVSQRVLKTDGNLGELWNLKKLLGERAKWDANRPTEANQLYQALNQALNKDVNRITDVVSDATKQPLMKELNRQYAALVAFEDLATKQAGSTALSPNLIGNTGNNALANVAGTLGAAVGGAPGAAVGYSAAQLGTAGMRSTQGRLARANLGEKLGQDANQARAMLGMQIKQGADQAAFQANPQAIPRTLDGFKGWLQQNIQSIPPQLAAIAQRLQIEPPSVAAATVRTLMPMFNTMMTPSVYPSEFDGHALEPQDRFKIAKQIDALPGITKARAAALKSDLYKTGKIPPEVYVPAPPESAQDQEDAFVRRLINAGH